MVVTAETKEEFKKESRYRPNLLFDEKAPIMIDDYTLEELRVVIKKAKKKKPRRAKRQALMVSAWTASRA